MTRAFPRPTPLPLVLAVLAPLLALPLRASGPVTGTYKVVIIQTTYSDGPGTVSTQANLNLAGGEIHDYFAKLSFGALDVEVTIGRAALTHPMSHYWSSCPASDDAGKMCVDEGALTGDAAEAAGAGGASFTNVKAVVVLSPCGVNDPYDNFTAGGDQDLSSTHAHAHVHRIFDTDCPDNPSYPLSEFPHLGPSGVNWHGWVHEIGHSLQLEGHDMFSHPGGYSSGYDLMDSCYPCGETVYSLSGNPVVSDESKTSFPGWLPASKTVTIPKPSSGTAGGTYVLEPVNKADPGATVAPRGIKLPLEGDRSIFVEARTDTGADNRSYGLFDEGVHMYIAEENRSVDGWATPLTMLNACDTTVSGGCVNSDADPRYSTCLTPHAHVADSHPYCWPFVLWHPGDTFNDPINAIMMHVNGRVGDGYGVTVTRGVPPGHPDPFLYPWLTAPMNTYETVDIWVDSSCNGYEDTVGAAGLRYGRRGDGTVIGNGDDPCANHENRIYARVHNGGSVPANNVTVHFQVTDPLGVGVSGSWTEVGSTTIPAIPADSYRDVYVNWTPHVTLTEPEIEAGHFNFHSCVQIILTPIPSEIVTSNNQAQENFDHFEAVRDPVTHDFHVDDRYFFVANNYGMAHGNITGAAPGGSESDFSRPIQLRIHSELPPDWHYEVNGGVYDFTLAPHEVKQVPVKVQVPPGTPMARTFNLRVTAFAQHHMINRAVPSTSANYWHFGWMQIAGVVEGVHTVDPSKLTLTAEFHCPDTRPATMVPPSQLVVKGQLDPHLNNVIIAIDYTPPGGGSTVTHLVHTDAGGQFQDTLNNPSPGVWLIRALWQGNMEYAGAVSDQQKVEVGRCENKPTQPQPTPPGSTVLLPSGAFPGGVLTGVVLGPDDKPVPNTPVQIAGGVPITLTGVVIGEEEPTKPQPPQRQPCVPDAAGNLPPGCPPARPKPPQPQPCPTTATGAPGPNCPLPTLPPVNAPQDCAGLLKQAQSILAQPGNQGVDHILIGLSQPSAGQGGIAPTDTRAGQAGIIAPTDLGAGAPYLSKNGGGVMTDANGRFAMCVPIDAPKVDVGLPNAPGGATPAPPSGSTGVVIQGGLVAHVPVVQNPTAGIPSRPPQFFQPGDKVNLIGLLRRPTLEQGGQTWILPFVQAISPNGEQAITAFQAPRDLAPGPVKFSFFDRNGQQQTFTGGVFKILNATLDRSKLRSQEGADFSYTVQFGDGSVRACVSVSVTGPVVLVQAPPPEIPLDASGVGHFGGKIRATQVAPGAAIPFDIKPDITNCGGGGGGTAAPTPQATETQPAAGGSEPPSIANLRPGATLANPWGPHGTKTAGPSHVEAAEETGQGPEGMAAPASGQRSGGDDAHSEAPAPLPPCTVTQQPAITRVTYAESDTALDTLTTSQMFLVRGCNFDVSGEVYLDFPPPQGQTGPGTTVELTREAWSWNQAQVQVPEYFLHLDQDNIRLRLVTLKNKVAEATHLKFHARRAYSVLTWMPMSHVIMGAAVYEGQVYRSRFLPTGSQQYSYRSADNLQKDFVGFTVTRTADRVGGPLMIAGDLFDFSGMQPGFVVDHVNPFYADYEGCGRSSGTWNMHWESGGTVLNVVPESCYSPGSESSESSYGLTVTVLGPDGFSPWPESAH
ncbi:MAG TPA: hypothetical protein VEG08_14380 [Terriglobales bacterium]|nr:hypothetical protein [Terriglobales bacterium]